MVALIIRILVDGGQRWTCAVPARWTWGTAAAGRAIVRLLWRWLSGWSVNPSRASGSWNLALLLGCIRTDSGEESRNQMVAVVKMAADSLGCSSAVGEAWQMSVGRVSLAVHFP